jgi:glucokinase
MTFPSSEVPDRSGHAYALDGARCFVADLGGTHVRGGTFQGGSLLAASTARWTEVGELREVLSRLLDDEGRPEFGCLAVAGPVSGPDVRLTNVGVRFDSEELCRQLGMRRLLVVNDVAALARSVEVLPPERSIPITGQSLRFDRPIVVVAPGTGLGVAACVPTSQRPVVVGGEGGHIPLPVTALGLEVTRELLAERPSISAEDLVSGTGLPLLDIVVRRLHGERDPQVRTGPEITASGDERVLSVFVDLLAAVAQTHALTFAARGGVLLAGGFLRDMVPVLQRHDFIGRFRRHDKMGELLESIPVVVDLREHSVLVGAGLLLEDELRTSD